MQAYEFDHVTNVSELDYWHCIFIQLILGYFNQPRQAAITHGDHLQLVNFVRCP